MNFPGYKYKRDLSIDTDALVGLIAASQRTNGEIPWCAGQKTDPWAHVEAAMGLTIGGRYEAARRAFQWLQTTQLTDGSWYAAYLDGVPRDRTRDSNLTAYIAVGLYHYYRVTGDEDFIVALWPTMARAMDFAVGLQTAEGSICWALDPDGKVDPMALLTGSSSIYMSLNCALALARLLGKSQPNWDAARDKLARAIRHKRPLFNMTKSRFSMDWFYPVLTGVLTGGDARRRIDKYWKKFVVEGLGVRCVFDEPWVTVAETCELVLALTAMGHTELAGIVFGWISDKCFEDGTYWCGFTFPDMVIWPEEKITWTNAVVLMALDALFQLTPAHDLFSPGFGRGRR
ncbi:MAG: phenyltransferase domain-containing protein [Desulfosarcina sp.]|nr:phenyltransferase domain-containing protein [Desulfobacterales bacterium]